MNHFPETTAALRRLARAIAGLFKSPSQLYAELCLKHEIEILEAEYENFKRVEKLRKSIVAYQITNMRFGQAILATTHHLYGGE